ncbi:MAG: hypothetical protein HYX67_17565 [Candidatus Melainabacteria bacterium]|nr:hypothetical protein [Candidatus Melainabacteria bacterium]
MTQSEVNQVLVESVDPLPFHVEEVVSRVHQLADHFIKIGCVAAIANLLLIIALVIFVNPLFAGKFLLIEVMVILSALCLAVFKFQGEIMSKLTQAEEIAYVVRDQAFVDLNVARDELRRLRHKLRRDTDDEGYGHVNELLKMISPLVMMFVQKEKNILRWGMFGWKVAQNAMAVIQQRSKES